MRPKSTDVPRSVAASTASQPHRDRPPRQEIGVRAADGDVRAVPLSDTNINVGVHQLNSSVTHFLQLIMIGKMGDKRNRRGH